MEEQISEVVFEYRMSDSKFTLSKHMKDQYGYTSYELKEVMMDGVSVFQEIVSENVGRRLLTILERIRSNS